MLGGFSTQELTLVALTSAALFVMELVVTVALQALGVPGVDFLLIIVLWTTIAITGGLLVQRFGTYALMALIYSVLAIPTPVFGPPGAYKVLAAVLVGLAIDGILSLTDHSRTGYYVAAAVGQMLGMVLFAAAFILLGFPGTDKLLSSLHFLIPAYGVLALPGVWLGYALFRRVKDKGVIKQFHGRS